MGRIQSQSPSRGVVRAAAAETAEFGSRPGALSRVLAVGDGLACLRHHPTPRLPEIPHRFLPRKRQAAGLLLRLVFPLLVSDQRTIVEVRFDTGRSFADRYRAQLANMAPVPALANGWYPVKVSHAAPLFTRALNSLDSFGCGRVIFAMAGLAPVSGREMSAMPRHVGHNALRWHEGKHAACSRY
jgi:hypothetical protein